MHASQYDSDVTTWSPQGRIFQIEYAMEAIKQGSACLALRSDTHCVIAAYKRLETQKKIYKIDNQIGCTLSGLNADARSLSTFMKEECMGYKFTNESPLPVSRLVGRVADKAQKRTMGNGPRPFGVGIILAGVDQTGPHIYQTDPSGRYDEYFATTMGAKSQGIKTYLERHFKSFSTCNVNALVAHAILALQASSQDAELGMENCSIAVVGIGEDLKEFTVDEIKERLATAKTFNSTTSTFN
ncbi:putative Proteasome subunit alpha type-1 [Blattamonas nauphoetae]|uniref:Proteasome subunit alpha type n=1 Tax=Blattamonas nauphoetae TaxID=2049346 RepID=A0ABQ9Y666_9EUKA|nr:putative Proteasome subunit alpha type-1 [Blattamonas nauphoetae]